MRNYLVLSITRAVEGRQKEMLRWYDEQHIPDILSVKGFSNPRRFKMADVQLMPGEPQDQYVTLFDLSCDDANEVVATVESRMASGEVAISDSVGEVRVLVVEPIATRIPQS